MSSLKRVLISICLFFLAHTTFAIPTLTGTGINQQGPPSDPKTGNPVPHVIRQVEGVGNRECFRDFESCVREAGALAAEHQGLYSKIEHQKHTLDLLTAAYNATKCGVLSNLEHYPRQEATEESEQESTTTSASTPTMTGPVNGTSNGNSSTASNAINSTATEVEFCAKLKACKVDTWQHRMNLAAPRQHLEDLQGQSNWISERTQECLFLGRETTQGGLSGNLKVRRNEHCGERLVDVNSWLLSCQNEKGDLEGRINILDEKIKSAQIISGGKAVLVSGQSPRSSVTISDPQEQGQNSAVRESMKSPLVMRREDDCTRLDDAYKGWEICAGDTTKLQAAVKGKFKTLADMQEKQIGNLNPMHSASKREDDGEPLKAAHLSVTLSKRMEREKYLRTHQARYAAVLRHYHERYTLDYVELFQKYAESIERGWRLVGFIQKEMELAKNQTSQQLSSAFQVQASTAIQGAIASVLAGATNQVRQNQHIPQMTASTGTVIPTNTMDGATHLQSAVPTAATVQKSVLAISEPTTAPSTSNSDINFPTSTLVA